MGYFSNGTEAEIYQEQYCRRCWHSRNETEGCPVWLLHLLHNYGRGEKATAILSVLIPEVGITNGKCTMFVPLEEVDAD